MYKIVARFVRRLFVGTPRVSLVKDLTAAAAARQCARAYTERMWRMLSADLASTGEVSLVRRVSLVKDLTSDAAIAQLHWAAASRTLRMIEASQTSGGSVTLNREDLVTTLRGTLPGVRRAA